LNTQAVIFVVDSNDGTRLKEARDELWKVLESPELNNAVILVFANKQDLPNALSAEEVSNGLDMKKITSHPWHVQPACATTGEGLDEGFDWLADRIKVGVSLLTCVCWYAVCASFGWLCVYIVYLSMCVCSFLFSLLFPLVCLLSVCSCETSLLHPVSHPMEHALLRASCSLTQLLHTHTHTFSLDPTLQDKK
jgi:ADP-ribosylation factor family